MRRASVASCALVLCASLVAGCGASHQRGLAGGGAGPPPWLGRIVTREARLLGDGHPNPVEYHFGKRRDVVRMFGRFAQHGWNLRLVVSVRTHRIISTAIGQHVAHTQAPEIAWHASPFFHIFPRGPATVGCRIPRGGPGAVRLRGRCTTSYVRAISPNSGRIRVAFVERWGHRSGGWVVTVGPSGRVLGFRLTGQLPPQLWM